MRGILFPLGFWTSLLHRDWGRGGVQLKTWQPRVFGVGKSELLHVCYQHYRAPVAVLVSLRGPACFILVEDVRACCARMLVGAFTAVARAPALDGRIYLCATSDKLQFLHGREREDCVS